MAGVTWRGSVEPEIRTSWRHVSEQIWGRCDEELTGMLVVWGVFLCLQVVVP
jgi:hypothetical protein